MKKIALIVGSDFKRNLPVASEVFTFLQDVPVGVKIQSDFAKEIGQEPPFLTDKEVVSDVDMVLVIGGDGTLLQAARLACPEGIPICGLNMGRLGFLSELDTQNWRSALTSILEGNFYLEERLTLKGTLFRDDGILREWLAINDVVLARNGFPHLMTLDIWLDGKRRSHTLRMESLLLLRWVLPHILCQQVARFCRPSSKRLRLLPFVLMIFMPVPGLLLATL